jgi:hypothetical protein
VAWVLNYRVKAWYRLDLEHIPTCFAIVDGNLYFGTSDGYIMAFNKDTLTYDGTTITAEWKMGYTDFGADWLRKTAKRMFVSIAPMRKTHVDVSYETDVLGESKTYTASYGLSTFEHANFAHWSFATNYGPKPFRFKIKAKKIDYFRFILRNNGSDSAIVVATLLTGVALFTVGALRSLIISRRWWIAGLEMFIVGALTAVAAYMVGWSLSRITGVSSTG